MHKCITSPVMNICTLCWILVLRIRGKRQGWHQSLLCYIIRVIFSLSLCVQNLLSSCHLLWEDCVSSEGKRLKMLRNLDLWWHHMLGWWNNPSQLCIFNCINNYCAPLFTVFLYGSCILSAFILQSLCKTYKVHGVMHGTPLQPCYTIPLLCLGSFQHIQCFAFSFTTGHDKQWSFWLHWHRACSISPFRHVHVSR